MSEKGASQGEKAFLVGLRRSAQISVGLPLAPEDEAVPDGNRMVGKILFRRIQTLQGICQIRAAGLPFPDGGAAFGGGDAGVPVSR